MKLYKTITILFFTILLFTVQVKSQDLVTDRPDQTESSVTVPKGKLQIESGMLFSSFGKSRSKIKSTVIPTTLLRFGITDGIELRFMNQFEKVKEGGISNSGMNDLEIGAKIQLLKNKDVNTEIAFLTHFIIPSGADHFRAAKAGSINKLAISHSLSDNIGLGYNVGYSYFGEGNGDFTYSLALGIGLSDEVAIFFEPYGEIVEFKDFQANFDTGITYLLKDNFQLDLSFGVGLNHRMSFVGAGFSWII